jgi:hypothetical protein
LEDGKANETFPTFAEKENILIMMSATLLYFLSTLRHFWPFTFYTKITDTTAESQGEREKGRVIG